MKPAQEATPKNTDQKIAEQYNVHPRTVRKFEKFTDAVDKT